MTEKTDTAAPVCRENREAPIILSTRRMRLSPMSNEELAALSREWAATDPELSGAYAEMEALCRAHPDARLFYTSFRFTLTDGGVTVGDAGFKGPPRNGIVEVGYGVLPAFEGHGYATEGVAALCRFAFRAGGARFVEAETAPDNRASQRVLAKLGFRPTGENGAEGPRFRLAQEDLCDL